MHWRLTTRLSYGNAFNPAEVAAKGSEPALVEAFMRRIVEL